MPATTFWPPPSVYMEADPIERLRDILDAARPVADYVTDVTEADFRHHSEEQAAVIRRLEIIGEATAHWSEATRRATPNCSSQDSCKIPLSSAIVLP